MPSFQLKMATQLGEKVSAEFSFTEFAVKAFEIACDKAKSGAIKVIIECGGRAA